MEAFKNILKIGILLFIIFLYFKGMVRSFAQFLDMELSQTVQILFQDAFNLILQIALAFLVLAFFDYLYQWWEYEYITRLLLTMGSRHTYKMMSDMPSLGDCKLKQQ